MTSKKIIDPMTLPLLMEEYVKAMRQKNEELKALYRENKKITDDNYDKSLAVKCVNGTFVGRKVEDIIEYRGIPFVGKQPLGNFAGKRRWTMQRTTAYTRPIPTGKPHARGLSKPLPFRVRTACI